MDRENWPDLAVFAAIAELGSFTKAASRFGVSASGHSHAMRAMEARLAAFADAYPDITVELVIDDGLVDIVAGRFDAGVRHQHALEQDMVSVRVSGLLQLSVVS